MPILPDDTESQALMVGLVVVHGQLLRAAERAARGDRLALHEVRYLAAHLVLMSLALAEAQNPARA